ncbi:Tar ligand binding domain-containing protein [Erwinia amylovora]|uniref:Tar ligand binding domain-containing protein n=1 Tax=Erwinia amylovora TaxID=552 RepID=UPI001443A09A|nr:Tar ligand binding domain-containing protein [Erwinia amylovora]
MPSRKYILIGFAIFMLVVMIGISNSATDTKKLKASSHDIDLQIGVILSLIDPINHGRTSQMYLENYLDEIDSRDFERAAESLILAKSLLVKADAAFAAFIQTELLAGEEKLRESYRASYLNLRQQGMDPLMASAERHDRVAFSAASIKVAKLRSKFEKHLSGELMLHEKYSQQLNAIPGDKYFFSIIMGLPYFEQVKGINYVVPQI